MRKRECLNGEWLFFLPDYEGVDPQHLMYASNWENEKK